MKTHLLSISGLFFALAACSQQGARLTSQLAQGNVVLKADNFSAKTSNALPASFANNKDVRVTVSHPTVKFRTSVELRDDIYKKKTPSNKPLIRVTVTNEKGEVVETQQREGAEIDWEVRLLGDDGNFDIKASIVGGAGGEGELESKVFLFKLDSSAPAVSSLSNLRMQFNGASRTLSVALKVADASAVTCQSQVAPGVVSSQESIDLVLSPAQGDPAKPTEHNFTAESITLPEEYPNTLLVKTRCADVAGLASEITESVDFKQPTFNINGVVLAEKSVPAEDLNVAGAPQRYMLRTATAVGGVSTAMPLSLKLIDKATNAEAPADVVMREKSRLQVYLSNFEFTSANDGNDSTDPSKKIFLRKLFANTIDAALPSALTKKQTLFLSVTQIQESDGQEILLGSHPISVYVEPNGKQFSYEWVGDHQFVPAALNATLNAQIRITQSNNEGSAFKQWPAVEYSTNGNTWTPFATGSVFNWQSVSGTSDTYKFQMKYPFADEQSFRVRVVATSLAGNVSTSRISKNLVAPAGFTMNTTPCNGAGLAVAKGSSFLCKKEINGVTQFFAMLVLRNNGNSTFTIPNNVTFDCASGSCVTISGTRNGGSYTEKLNVSNTPLQSTSFVNGAQVMFPYGLFNQGDIAKHPLFDATFGVNGPTCAASPAPSAVLKNATLNLTEGPFDCE